MEVRSLSELLQDSLDTLKGQENITLRQLLEIFHERGFGMVLFVLALPMALPVPVPPGVNVALALPLIILTAQQMLGRHTIWMPAYIKNKSFKQESLSHTFEKAVPFIRKMEWFVRPRLGGITHGIFSNLIGLAGFVMALSICVPLPLTNTIPSFGIACMALGVIMRDGLAVLFGMALGLAWITFLVVLGETGLRLALSSLG